MKYTVQTGTSFDEISRYLSPVCQYGEEKRRKNMQDDWDELAHTSKWLENTLKELDQTTGSTLDIYYCEENGDIIGVVFLLSNSEHFRQALAADHVFPKAEKIAQLTCFHIVEAHRNRGLGRKWLEEEIFPDLRNQGIQTVYIRSSHHQALGLYRKLGAIAGNYIGISDHKLYQRYGYIFEINI